MADEDRIMLEITGLKKKFGEDVILDGVDLTINKGEVVVMLGSSGCGKSTLLRCINGLESFDKGSIRIDGEEIVSGSKNLPQLRQKIGMVFQSYDLSAWFSRATIYFRTGIFLTISPLRRSRCRSARKRTRERRRNSFSGASDSGKSAKPIPESFPAVRSSVSPLYARFA